jgi:hypothetical protein
MWRCDHLLDTVSEASATPETSVSIQLQGDTCQKAEIIILKFIINLSAREF